MCLCCMCVHVYYVCMCVLCAGVQCWRVASLGVGSGVWGVGSVRNVKRFYDMVCRIVRVCWRWCMGVGVYR